MDKKTGIIVSILAVIVIALVGVAIFVDSNDPYIVTINDVKYEKEGFENYYKIRYVEELEALENEQTTPEDRENADSEQTASADGENADNKQPTEVDKEALKEEAFNEYTYALLLNQIAAEKGYKADANLVTEIEGIYDAESFDKEKLTELGITREIYVSTKVMSRKADDFYSRLDEFYSMSDEEVEEYMELAKEDLKGYDFRMMQFAITKNEEDGTTNKEEVLAKAKDILEKVKAGEDFEKLAKDNATMRFVIWDSELKQINGELESVDKPYLQGYLSDEKLYNALTALKAGECTELIESEQNVTFMKLEAIKDGVAEETKEAMKKELYKNQGMTEIYYSAPSVITNTRLLKSIEI